MNDGKDGGGAKILSLVRPQATATPLTHDREQAMSRRVVEILRTMFKGMKSTSASVLPDSND